MESDFLREMEQRKLVHQVSSPALGEVLRNSRLVAYAGFDPSADSLGVGNLVQLVQLMRLQRAGHRPIGLIGGGTGMVGDPSGKSGERTLLATDEIERNAASVRKQVEHFLDSSGENGAVIADNTEWLSQLRMLDFLRDIGKHFSVNQMIARDSVRMRLEGREHGISYTEFTYMLLQAYDYLELYDRYGCTLQIGGSDQWGNILSGADLIRRLRGVEAYALTTPLITQADGSKFGKTEAGNVWLDPERTSPYQFYQFWLNTGDKDAVQYLNTFTLLPIEQIADLERELTTAPEKRGVQHLLAEEVTRLVHGPEALARAQRATTLLFSKDADFRQFSEQELREAFLGAPTTRWETSVLGTPAAGLIAAVTDAGLYPSRGQAKKDLPSGSIFVNNVPIRDANHVLSAADLLAGGFIILRKGKKHYHVLRVAAR
jgi:tyrosyl-tRNA synthetase